MSNVNFSQSGPEFKLLLEPRFHEWNSCPIKADWYDIKLTTGTASITIPYDIFTKLSSAADELVRKDNL